MDDIFHGLGARIERDPARRLHYEARVASAGRVLDVGGRNRDSLSARRLRQLSTNPAAEFVHTDVLPDYQPDLVDDITASTIPDASFDGIYCVSILEHVRDCPAAVGHLRRILKPGGEIVLYVPFCWPFHDRMDHHRFTFTEVARLMEGYADFRLCLPDRTGYGGVLLEVLTFFQCHRLPWLWEPLSVLVNALLTLPLTAAWLALRNRGRWRGLSLADFRFYYLHLHLAHGFWAWGKKGNN